MSANDPLTRVKSEWDWIYFGKNPKCGHVVAAVVDNPAHKKETGKTVGSWVREGYDITRQANQEGLVWCNEDCPAMKEIRAEQAAAAERKAKRRRNSGSLLSAVVVLLLCSACQSPTEPDVTVPLTFTGVQVSDSQKEAAFQEWDRQKECVGWHGHMKEPLRVDAKPGWFSCGTIGVNGCTFPGSIQVNVQVYVSAVSHELIHWMLMDSGRSPDSGHTGEIWPRCDVLNWK